jgi:hypothetical protein
MGRYSHYSAIRRNIFADNRICPNRHIISDGDVAKYFGTGTDPYVVAYRRAVCLIRIADRYLLIDPTIPTNAFGADPCRESMLDEQARSNHRREKEQCVDRREKKAGERQ